VSTYRLTVEYDGTDFHGWQRQPAARTVEGELRRALAAVTCEEPALTAAGRTDAGAHAHGQVVGCTLERDWDALRFRDALNAHLPDDVAVVDARPAEAEFHARYDALARTYRYVVVNRDTRGPVTRRHAWAVRSSLDIDAMRTAAASLRGTHDFAAFGSAPRPGGSTVRTVHDVAVDRVSVGDDRPMVIVITVTADAFLRGMMRAFAGALVSAGRGRMSAADVVELVAHAGDRAPRLTIAPARGLHQWSVAYGDDVAWDPDPSRVEARGRAAQSGRGGGPPLGSRLAPRSDQVPARLRDVLSRDGSRSLANGVAA